jgi:hypothetical protein
VVTRYFTLDEAQALVPRVRALLGQALQLHGHLRVAIARLSADGFEVTWAVLRGELALRTDGPDEPDELDDEIDEIDEIDAIDPQAVERTEEAIDRARMIYATLREVVAQIEALGVEVKAVIDGLVDFRSWCDGEHEVLLCWKLGEDEIRFFHGLEDGFAGRRPVKGHRFTSERTVLERRPG